MNYAGLILQYLVNLEQIDRYIYTIKHNIYWNNV